MAETFGALGSTIGDILSRATGARTSGPQGYSAGVDAGSNQMLRSAQSSKMLGELDKVMYELNQARAGDSVTAKNLAGSMGVGGRTYDALAVPGTTSLPAIPGDEGPSPAVPIPQDLIDKFNNANTIKTLQQLSGGTSAGANVDTMMSALLKGQKLGTRSNLQSGAQSTDAVAAAEAALKGELPGAAGGRGGGSVTAKVQETSDLVRRNIGLGMDKEEAVRQAVATVYGDAEAKQIDALMQSMVRSGYYDSQDIMAMLPELLKTRGMALGRNKPPAPGAAPGNVVKVYK